MKRQSQNHTPLPREKIKKLIKFSFKKLIVVIVVLVVVVIITVVSLQNANSKSGYIFGKVEKTSLSEIVTESGTIISHGNIPIFSPTNGKISEIYVNNGQQVTDGQQLFNVDSSATELEQQTAYTNYLTAKSTLDTDTANAYTLQSAMYEAWKKYMDLATNSTYENADKSPNNTNRTLPEFTVAQNDWLASEATLKNQQGVIAKDQASLASAYTAYMTTQNATVKSPMDGIVENIGYAINNSVQSQSALTPTAKPVLILKNDEAFEAVVPVGQTNIAKIKIGQLAVIKPDAYKDKTYQGNIVRIDALGENNQGVVTYNVYIALKNDAFLKAGMTFDSDITTKKLENVLTVPNSAILLDKGAQTVRTFANNKLIFTPVVTGVRGETRTQIISGLKEGQEIITALTNERAQRPGFLGL